MKLYKLFIIPQRVIVSIMSFLSIVVAYTMRICLSMAITELVVRKNHTTETGSIAVCDPDEVRMYDKHSHQYKWSEELQGRILASFYVGYIVTHLPGGVWSDKFGGKWVLSLGILLAALLTLLTPYVIIEGGPNALIVLRILIGAGQGTVFPACSKLLSMWAPPKERGKLGALVLGGGQIGTIVSNFVSGMLIDAYDWQIVFYFFGGLSILWFIIFTILCYSEPATHPFISPKELEYLETTMGPPRTERLPPTPWKAIFTNMPMIALISAQIGHDWGYFIMVTDLPKYMADVMRVSIKDNGIYSALPFILMWIISIISGFVADAMVSKNCMSVTNVRKLMTAIAAFGPAILMVAASYAGCNRALVVTLFTLCMGSMGTYFAGMKLSPLDMSPNYAGTLMAITNGIGAFTGVIAPYSVGLMTPNATMLEWRMVFWAALGVLSSTCIVYCIWASGEVQPFNEPPPRKD